MRPSSWCSGKPETSCCSVPFGRWPSPPCVFHLKRIFRLVRAHFHSWYDVHASVLVIFLAYSVVGHSQVVQSSNLEILKVPRVLRQQLLMQTKALPFSTPFVDHWVKRLLPIGPQVGHCKVKLKNQHTNVCENHENTIKINWILFCTITLWSVFHSECTVRSYQCMYGSRTYTDHFCKWSRCTKETNLQGFFINIRILFM